MKIKFWYAVIIFLSAYSPLSVIFLIQGFDLQKPYYFENHWFILAWITVSIFSVVITTIAVKTVNYSGPLAKIQSVKNISGELLNYSIPYMISFFALDLSNTRLIFSFLFFLGLLFFLTYKTHNVFINPILTILGYKLYDVEYEQLGKTRNNYLLSNRRLIKGMSCKTEAMSDHMFLTKIIS